MYRGFEAPWGVAHPGQHHVDPLFTAVLPMPRELMRNNLSSSHITQVHEGHKGVEHLWAGEKYIQRVFGLQW